MTRRSVPEAWLPAVTPAGRRSKGIRIGLPAVAGLAVLGDEARRQMGVESDREVIEVFYTPPAGPTWFFNTNWLSDAPLAEWHGVRRTTRVV